ncbi:MAG: DnaB-like helicase N-terminal domain-containing protein [Sporichthyaceae bacterium]
MERATLGALLLCGEPPSGERHDAAVAGWWLRPEDFADPWHREVYRTIRALSAAGETAGPEAVGLEMLRRLGPTRADVVRIAGLLHDVPVTAQAATYSAMVLEASLRRETAAQGVILRAGALQSTLEASPRPIIAITALIDTVLDDAGHRWAAATNPQPIGADRRSAAPTPLRTSIARLDGALAADRLLDAHPSVSARDVAEHEARLIAALLTHPGHIGRTAGWLRPAAVTNRAWRPVYEAMLRLHTYGRPVDAVTVLWEVQRSSRTDGPGPDPATVTAGAEAALAANPAHWSRVVAADHLRSAADRAAESLHTTAANPGLDLGEVLGTGHILTEALRTAARPLTAPPGDARRLASVHALPARQPDRAGPVAG